MTTARLVVFYAIHKRRLEKVGALRVAGPVRDGTLLACAEFGNLCYWGIRELETKPSKEEVEMYEDFHIPSLTFEIAPVNSTDWSSIVNTRTESFSSSLNSQ